jgi:phage tail-like protein
MNGKPDPVTPPPVSSYQAYLPALLQGDEFVGRFLLAFEQILTGIGSKSSAALPQIIPSEQDRKDRSPKSQALDCPGLEQVIDHIHTYLSPTTTPKDFLPWLASWVALSLRDDWKPETKQQFISKIVPLYRLRGTKTGLKTMLELYLNSVGLPDQVNVFEFPNHPHYFQVRLVLPIPDPNQYWQQIRIAKAIIDQEKPAHTYYGLQIHVPTMRLTGQFFPVLLPRPSLITAQITGSDIDMKQLRLSIKSKLGREPVAVAGSDRRVTHTVSPTEFEQDRNWYVVIDYFGKKEMKVELQISIISEGVNPINDTYTLSLQPALQIITPPEPPNQINIPSNGNTVLGTVASTVSER